MYISVRKLAFMLALVSAVRLHPIQAQIPAEFENLQVLPKDISRGELMQNMRGFALGLGVRCWHCHVGEEGMPLSEYDFASDAKETKQIARVMIQMRQAINSDFLTRLADIREASLEVDCVTCHRGAPKPEMLENVLFDEITENGIEAGIEKYRDLRENYYGGFTYNFAEFTLNQLAERLTKQAQNPDAAIAVLRLNLEFHPESWLTFLALGEVYSMQGKKESALKAYQKAYSIRPNPRLKQKIESLSSRE